MPALRRAAPKKRGVHPLIEVKHLTKRYGKHTAVDDISFTVQDGCIYGLLGPNGAGKSTTMNMITGYLAPTGGTVAIDGHDVQEEPKEAKACIGYLPEIPPLYTDMTVQEYLLFVSELKGKKKKADRVQDVAQAVQRAGLQEMEKRLIRNLSKGYRQRVGIAAALLGSPKVIILDEPTVGLDPAQMIEIRNLIHDLGETHTVILSSHILSEVQTICDRVLIIAHGKVAAQGTPEELAAQLAARGMIAATALGTKEQILAAAAKVEGLTDLRVTAEKGDEVSFTPEISNITRPGLTTATQHSKLPLPLPIRTPIGLPVTGLSGKIFINTLPPRLMYLVIATRAASIWFDLIQHGSVATIPYSPLVILLPLVALPAIEPRNCLRCLTLLGSNITYRSLPFLR